MKWWDETWNPVGGCSPISPGCTNCYAAALAVKYGQYTGAKVTALHPGVAIMVNGRPVFTGELTTARRGHALWSWPTRWLGAEHPVLGDGQPSIIFCGDMTDVFAEGRPAAVVTKICAMLAFSDHIGLLLTKRTARMASYFGALDRRTVQRWRPKLWLGFSAERQLEFDKRWNDVRPLADAGWTIFLSAAPLIGPVTLPPDFLSLARWVIVAGEQGPHRDCRNMDPRWARAIRDQCGVAGIAFFMKQMSKKRPIPPDLLIRQFPRINSSN